MKEFIEKFQWLFVSVLISAALIFFGITTGCKSLRVFDIKGQPQSCNDLYTQMDWNLQTGSTNVALITLWMKECQVDRGNLKNKNCLQWIYRGEKLDKNKHELYVYYLECIK